jgi:TetR/AcrR family transcriptional regulator, transcriptional repressor for nem operon
MEAILSKSERTKKFILKTVAPVFSKHGYAGTSLADITRATGLTKGAIYGNFENKEQLALASFNFNLKRVLKNLNDFVGKFSSPIQQLHAINDFYRQYYAYAVDFGGCPLITGGVDSNHQNPLLFARVKQMTWRIRGKSIDIILEGIEKGEFKENLDPHVYANRIFAMIEGSLFLGILMNEPNCVDDMMDHIDSMIENEMRK